jgi:hypothetical protein
MKQFLLFLSSVTLLAACSKGKFETVPNVVIKSFGPEMVAKGGVFELVAEITDKEGDLLDSVTLVRKRFTNNLQVPVRTDDTTRLRIADFANPNSSTIELKITFGYGRQVDGTQLYNIQEAVERGLVYSIFVSDKAKNKSAVVETKRITLEKF